jgi:hypothetical protein
MRYDGQALLSVKTVAKSVSSWPESFDRNSLLAFGDVEVKEKWLLSENLFGAWCSPHLLAARFSPVQCVETESYGGCRGRKLLEHGRTR